ncbi:hypothetical protein [Sandaracinus amylolyticus]|nr:hypothetical protein [Sandaracinus amylolyticus]
MRMVFFCSIAIALTACGSNAATSAFRAGSLSPTCGPAGGSAVRLVLADGELTCETPEPATHITIWAQGTSLDEVEIARAHGAERCIEGACASIVGGTVHTLRAEADRSEVRWSLELADGAHDEGTAWVRVCAALAHPCR